MSLGSGGAPDRSPGPDVGRQKSQAHAQLALVIPSRFSYPAARIGVVNPLRAVVGLKALAEILLRRSVLAADCPVCVGCRMTGADCSAPSDRKRAFLSR